MCALTSFASSALCWYSPTCVSRRYGDGSSVLGSCCGWGGDAGCFTYPDSVILGWHDPTYITEKQLPSGKSLSLVAPDTFASGTPATGWKVDVPSRTGWCVEWIYVCALCNTCFGAGVQMGVHLWQCSTASGSHAAFVCHCHVQVLFCFLRDCGRAQQGNAGCLEQQRECSPIKLRVSMALPLWQVARVLPHPAEKVGCWRAL